MCNKCTEKLNAQAVGAYVYVKGLRLCKPVFEANWMWLWNMHVVMIVMVLKSFAWLHFHYYYY